MTRSTIGGPLGLAEYRTLSQLHRPSDIESLAVEVRRMHSQSSAAQQFDGRLAGISLEHHEEANVLLGVKINL